MRLSVASLKIGGVPERGRSSSPSKLPPFVTGFILDYADAGGFSFTPMFRIRLSATAV